MYLNKRFQSMNYKQYIRRFIRVSMLTILALALGACNITLSIGAAGNSTPEVTEVGKDLQATPSLPTPTSENVGPSLSPNQINYVNADYGFEFMYPDTWTLEEDWRAILLKQDKLILRINYVRAGDNFGPGLFGRTGIGAGDFIYADKVAFMDQVISAEALVYEGKCKGLFYNQGNLIEVDDLIFTLVLEEVGSDYGLLDIADSKQSEATSIVKSFMRNDKAAECLEQGGRWEVLGFSGPGCNLPSSDGGASCTDTSDCESLCLADDETIMMDNGQGIPIPDSERIEEINAQEEELEGVCSMWQSEFGCRVVVENGKYIEICID